MKKMKGTFNFKRRVKIISYGRCRIYLTKDKPVNYWYCRVYNNNHSFSVMRYLEYTGDITDKFADIAPYFEYTHRLIIYHSMALKLICNRAKEIDDKYNNDFWYYNDEKPKKKRRIKRGLSLNLVA